MIIFRNSYTNSPLPRFIFYWAGCSLLLILLIFTACTQLNLDEVSFPVIETGSVEVDPVLPKARLNGEITGLVSQNFVDQHGHIWAATDALSLSNKDGQNPKGKTGNGLFESEMTDLTPGRTYFYRAYIQYEGEVKYGAVQSFMLSTFSPELAIDSIVRASNASSSTVYTTFSGLLVDLELLSYGLVWGNNPQPLIESDQIAPEQGLIVSESEFQISSQIFLSPGTNYVRPYLEVGDTTYYGNANRIFLGNIWTQKADFAGTGRTSVAGFSIGNKGYMGTGRTEAGQLSDDFWEFDPLTGEWTQKAAFKGGRITAGLGFSIGSKGYVAVVHRKELWEYDPVSNEWFAKADFIGENQTDAVGFSIENKGYIGTGEDNSGDATKEFWEYDPQTNEWTRKNDFGGEARSRAVGFSIGNKGYIGTGTPNIIAKLRDFWEYDPQTDEWSKKADLGGEVRESALGFSIGNKGYIGTGFFGNRLQDFWEYDPQTNEWTQRADYEGGLRSRAFGFSIGNLGYIGTGQTPEGESKNDFWEYLPVED